MCLFLFCLFYFLPSPNYLLRLLLPIYSLFPTAYTLTLSISFVGSNASSSLEASELLEEGVKKLEDLYYHSQGAGSLNELLEVQQALRKIPVVELDTPTVVLVGKPSDQLYFMQLFYFIYILLNSS